MQEFTALAATQYTGMPHGSDISKPTQNKGISLADQNLTHLWLMAVEDTEKVLSEKEIALLDIRRQAENNRGHLEPGRPSWIPQAQLRWADWHKRRYGWYYMPSDRAIKAWMGKIINIAARKAIKRGCL
jgi:hypothetical protein